MEFEKILCAAIWYKDLPKPFLTCVNTDNGVVLCGHRHGHIIAQMKALTELRTVTFAEDGVGEHEQGFLTNTNRFVNREEAAEIAFHAGQTTEKLITLYSEDLY